MMSIMMSTSAQRTIPYAIQPLLEMAIVSTKVIQLSVRHARYYQFVPNRKPIKRLSLVIYGKRT